jgi:hypothetical protein
LSRSTSFVAVDIICRGRHHLPRSTAVVIICRGLLCKPCGDKSCLGSIATLILLHFKGRDT